MFFTQFNPILSTNVIYKYLMAIVMQDCTSILAQLGVAK